MRIIKENELEAIRTAYPAGTRVVLLNMDDLQAPPVGTWGTVYGVDDSGSLLVHWDNGSSLNVVFDGGDMVRKVGNIHERENFDQIMSIRDSGAVNMLLTNEVQRIAFDNGFYELVCYIEDHRQEYWNFIMSRKMSSEKT